MYGNIEYVFCEFFFVIFVWCFVNIKRDVILKLNSIV